jgi:two-component system cell cycle sensor histidine kinase/response regulator CckA
MKVMDSHVVVSGEVSGSISIVGGDQEARFGLKGQGGSFLVKAFTPQLIQVSRSLEVGMPVTIVGHLRTFTYRRCRSHHVMIKAITISPGVPPLAIEAAMADLADAGRAVAEGGLVDWVLREYQDRYRHASEATSTVVYTLYPANGDCAANWAAVLAPIAGFSSDEVAGDWTRMVHPDDVYLAHEHVQNLFSRPGTVEFRVVTRGGGVRWVRDHNLPVQEEEEETAICTHGAAQDVTELKRLEARLLQMQEMALVGKLVQGIAYDFNDLLTVIGCRAEFLLHLAGDEHASPGTDAREILDACRRATRLTKRLLGLGRRQVLQPELLDLNVLVAEVGEMVRRMAWRVELEFALDPALGYIKADQGQVEQLVANLIIHACDHMPEGGKLVIKTGMAALPEDASDRPGPYVVLRMSCAALEAGRIWDSLDSSVDTQAGGPPSLDFACEAARRIGALVRVADVPEGATLDIYLPQAEAATSPWIPRALPQCGPETVLLLENEDAVREVVRRLLAEVGYQVLEAQRSDEALCLCEEHSGQVIRLALVDAALPGGMAASKLVERLAAAHPLMKVILLSDVEPDLDQNVGFLRKPFTHGDLLRMVREALAGVE